jgi:hypothetical protein
LPQTRGLTQRRGLLGGKQDAGHEEKLELAAFSQFLIRGNGFRPQVFGKRAGYACRPAMADRT